MSIFEIVGLIVLGLIVLSILLSGVVFVRPKEKGLVERFGKFRGVLGDGLHFVIPIVDQVYKVNITEQLVNVEPTEMITKDNLNVKVDAQVYFRVRPNDKDVKKAMYEVDDYDKQIVALAQTTARSVIGTMKFEKVNNDRQSLNNQLRDELEQQTDDWGINVVRVELEEITPPKKVQESMNEIVEAENRKDAADDKREEKKILAQGEKEAAIEEAEGKKRAAVLEAEGKAESIQLEAEAQANQIKVVNSAIKKYFREEAQTYKQLETAEKGLMNNTKFFLDTDTQVPMLFTGAMDDTNPITDSEFDGDVEDMDFSGVDIDSDIKEQVKEAQEEVEKAKEQNA